MTKDDQAKQETLALARDYVKHLEAGAYEEADNVLAELTDLRESQLFKELGRLTRDFHEALNSFQQDERIASMAEDEIPDARERLNYVITKTDDAAHKTLTAVEAAIPICESLEKTLDNLNGAWQKFLSKEMTPAEFRDLSGEIKEFFNSSNGDLEQVKSNLTAILMAQDFQDITGQIIRRVIQLVAEVEKSLVELVKLGGGITLPKKVSQTTQQSEEDKGSKLEGPQVPGLESEDVVASQDDVDELLSSLGF